MLPSVDPLLASVSEADPGRNRGRTAGYRGGIYAYLAHQRGQMHLFSRLPGGRPEATSGANRAKQRCFSPAATELRRRREFTSPMLRLKAKKRSPRAESMAAEEKREPPPSRLRRSKP